VLGRLRVHVDVGILVGNGFHAAAKSEIMKGSDLAKKRTPTSNPERNLSPESRADFLPSRVSARACTGRYRDLAGELAESKQR
jgi:hypothetical protein